MWLSFPNAAQLNRILLSAYISKLCLSSWNFGQDRHYYAQPTYLPTIAGPGVKCAWNITFVLSKFIQWPTRWEESFKPFSISPRFCKYSAIIIRSSTNRRCNMYPLPDDVDAPSRPVEHLEDVLQRVRKQFRRYDVSTTQLDWFCTLSLDLCAHRSGSVKTSQHLGVSRSSNSARNPEQPRSPRCRRLFRSPHTLGTKVGYILPSSE